MLTPLRERFERVDSFVCHDAADSDDVVRAYAALAPARIMPMQDPCDGLNATRNALCRNLSSSDPLLGGPQFFRLATCFEGAVRAWEAQNALQYSWVIRARPDLLWRQALPLEDAFAQRAISLRASRACGTTLRLGQLAKDYYWVGPNGCSDEPAAFNCTTYDDQLSIIPREYADEFFAFPFRWRDVNPAA